MLIPGFSSAPVNLWVNMWRAENTKAAKVGAVHSFHTPLTSSRHAHHVSTKHDLAIILLSNKLRSSQLWTQFKPLHNYRSLKKSGLQRGLNPWPRNTGADFFRLLYATAYIAFITAMIIAYLISNPQSIYETFHTSLHNIIIIDWNMKKSNKILT